MKLQQDFGYKPTAGCMPMLLNFLVMFGVIGVVYNPLERIFHISAAALASAGEALTAAGISFTAITRDTNIIAEVVAGNSGVLGCFTAQQIATITEFSQHMNFFGIDLTRIPQIGLSLDIVLPLLSVITMFLSTHISMKASGQQMQGSMKLTNQRDLYLYREVHRTERPKESSSSDSGGSSTHTSSSGSTHGGGGGSF